VSLTQTVYTAERAKLDVDGKRYRIVKRVEGPHAELRDQPPAHVADLTEQQAKRLRDELNEALDD